jgi:glutathione peroxidase
MKLLAVSFLLSVSAIVSIYTFTITSNSGTSIKLTNYQNKKIVLVNIATTGTSVSQLADIEAFYKKHKDSVLVIGFPSNSFGNTPGNNTQIKTFLTAQGITFPVTNKVDVTGAQAHPLYKWLLSKNDNGSHGVEITEDFQKVIISKQGKIRAVFGALIKPGSQFIQNALQAN